MLCSIYITSLYPNKFELYHGKLFRPFMYKNGL